MYETIGIISILMVQRTTDINDGLHFMSNDTFVLCYSMHFLTIMLSERWSKEKEENVSVCYCHSFAVIVSDQSGIVHVQVGNITA